MRETFYYDQFGNKEFSRWNALVNHRKNKVNYSFYFDDHKWSKVNWKTQPKESLQELYKQRAQQIRDQYDYILLCFSGGMDSRNILETFYYNNIHIDEILVVTNPSQKDKCLYSNFQRIIQEIELNALDLLKILNLSKTKITIFDHAELFSDPNNFDVYRIYGNEWYKQLGAYVSVQHGVWEDSDRHVSNNKKTGVIFGADKPLPTLRDDNFCIHFNDISCNHMWKQRENFYPIWFYWDADFPDIVRKQAHILYNMFLKYCISKQSIRMPDFLKYINVNLDTILFEFKNPMKISSLKAGTTILGNRDLFICDSNVELLKVFAEGIEKIQKELSSNLQEKFDHFYTQSYVIGKYPLFIK